ncbi:PAS domain-containing sensor histidine kinase [Nonlabens xiamenensis]|uniref:PAS domain-containing sensor histidine kinase n=1 Tax=Nonlabens xiamenensis TaxID=2341043 RepID=UPI000F60A5DD|nr:ATP-binding protein [Nonlabens xiamenensis]
MSQSSQFSDFPLQEIMDHSCVFTAVVGQDLSILKANQRLADLLGVDLDNQISLEKVLLNPKKWTDSVQQLDQGQDPIKKTLKFISKDHLPIYLKCSIGFHNGRYYMIGIDITDDVLAHKALVKVAQIAQMGGFTYNPYNDETYWTDMLYKILDLPGDYEPNGESIFDFIHPDHMEAFVLAVQSIYVDLEPYDIKVKVISFQGIEKWVRIAAYPENGFNEVLFVYGIFQDITVSETASLELRDLKETMEMALMAMNSGYFTFDLKQDDISYSKAFREELGFEDHLNKTAFKQLIHPDDVEQADQKHLEQLRDPNTQHYFNEYRLRAHDGNYQHYEVYGWKIFDKEAKVSRIIGNLINREKEHLLEVEKDKHERQLEVLIDNAFLHSVLLDKNFRIIAADSKTQHRLEKLIGVNPVLHQSDFTAVLNHEEAQDFNLLRSRLRMGDEIRMELAHQFLDPEAIYDTLYKPVLADKDAQPENYLLYFFDISEQRRIQNELKQMNHKVQQMHEMKTNILTKVGHELKTPMSSLLLTTDLLTQNPGQQMEEVLAAQRESVERINTTFDNIVNQSLVDQSITPLAKAINLTASLHQLGRTYDSKAQLKGLAYEFKNFSKPIIVDGDESFLVQSIGNVINNAIKFTEKGKVKIHCRESAGLAVIMIEDTGIGIKNELINDIFEPFHQVSSGDTRAFDGNGLGLSFTKSYLETIGGKISVSSVLNYGTLFTISLPLSQDGQGN